MNDLVAILLERLDDLRRSGGNPDACATPWGAWQPGPPYQPAYVVEAPTDHRFARIYFNSPQKGGRVSSIEAQLAAPFEVDIDEFERRLGPGDEGVRYSPAAARNREYRLTREDTGCWMVVRYRDHVVESVLMGVDDD